MITSTSAVDFKLHQNEHYDDKNTICSAPISGRPMNVVIAGGGVAGLTTAAALRRLPFVRSIIVFEPVRPPESCQDDNEKNEDSPRKKANKFNHFNGLWSPSLRCLDSLDIYGSIKDHLHAVWQSGYKDVSGRWLAQPTVGLKEPPGILYP